MNDKKITLKDIMGSDNYKSFILKLVEFNKTKDLFTG